MSESPIKSGWTRASLPGFAKVELWKRAGKITHVSAGFTASLAIVIGTATDDDNDVSEHDRRDEDVKSRNPVEVAP
jgi:hypothetical protein